MFREKRPLDIGYKSQGTIVGNFNSGEIELILEPNIYILNLTVVQRLQIVNNIFDTFIILYTSRVATTIV